jgi:hypothetical protein
MVTLPFLFSYKIPNKLQYQSCNSRAMNVVHRYGYNKGTVGVFLPFGVNKKTLFATVNGEVAEIKCIENLTNEMFTSASPTLKFLF